MQFCFLSSPSLSVETKSLLFVIHSPSNADYQIMKQHNAVLLGYYPDFSIAKIPATDIKMLNDSGLEYKALELMDSNDESYIAINLDNNKQFEPETMGIVAFQCDPYTLILRNRQYPLDINGYPGIQLYSLPDIGIAYPHSKFLSTPVPTPVYDPQVRLMVDQVSSTELFTHLTYLAVDLPTRYLYSPYCDDAVDYVYNYFTALGLTTNKQFWDISLPPNIVAIQTGVIRPDEQVILVAHLDSIVFSSLGDPMIKAPGADDNCSGSVAVMEAARILSGFAFENTLIFLIVTGEEEGLWGSEYYAQEAETRSDDIIGIINFDMVGWGGNGVPDPEDLDLVANGDSEWLADFFVYTSSLYLGVPALKHLDLGLSSDHRSFWGHGYSGILGISEIGTGLGGDPFYPYYHSYDDTIDKIDSDHLLRVAKGLVANGAHLAIPYYTPTPTITDTPTFTSTPTATRTLPPTRTFTQTMTVTPTYTASNTRIPSETPTFTLTFRPTASPTGFTIPDITLFPSLILLIIAGYTFLRYTKY
ncbi:MAG: hypothetical protein A2161_04000 [Candidatus Schekmanbacteria bacterium RBG_13_48_7]|uniref:Peptidase M28 domain-containing protein n=1 Tax=Candidatus Schekmanbacteria bacterium RBG_13_48_7 TaxID=1817878 RepID=A0A1F7RU70_9BACT|nr:MAG: hypothetical protein A2161_04000 [Candidatus Schekmanbacteria bacterium RBG_13_48_7]